MTVSNRPNSTPPRLAGLLSSILMIAMMLIPASPASAQLGAVAQAMEPEYFTRDLLIFIEGLDLDETQAVIAEAIFDDLHLRARSPGDPGRVVAHAPSLGVPLLERGPLGIQDLRRQECAQGVSNDNKMAQRETAIRLCLLLLAGHRAHDAVRGSAGDTGT